MAGPGGVKAEPGGVMEWETSGAFDLRQSIDFGFGARTVGATPSADEPAVMRLAFVLDGYTQHVGVAVRQPAGGLVHLTISGTRELDAAARQAARVLSVDVDASGWDALGARDPLIGRLQAARPGLRPPLFHSAYEALAWAVLSARQPRAQMARLHAALSSAHGAVVDVAGEPMPVFPTPEQLLGLESFPGLPEVKLRRLHGVASAALDGVLDTVELRGLTPAEAASRLQRLEGIGPFYSELVTVRTLGHTDVLPSAEPGVRAIAGDLLGRGEPLDQTELEQAAERWRPWRTWAAVALRAAGPLVSEQGAPGPPAAQ